MHLMAGKPIGRGVERLQGFVRLNAGGVKQAGCSLANQFSTDGMGRGVAFAAKNTGKRHNKAVRQKRAQNHKILLGARATRYPQEDLQLRERNGVERVVRRKLSGSEGELWQLSDDM